MTEPSPSSGIPPDTIPDTSPDITTGIIPGLTFEAQYKRVLAAAGCGTQAQLAAVLGIKQSAVSAAKRRKAVPSDWLVRLFEKQRLNPDWVRTGSGPIRLGPAEARPLPQVVTVTQVRPPAECSAQELFTELVRRALEPLDLEAIQKEVAATWLPAGKADGKP